MGGRGACRTPVHRQLLRVRITSLLPVLLLRFCFVFVFFAPRSPPVLFFFFVSASPSPTPPNLERPRHCRARRHARDTHNKSACDPSPGRASATSAEHRTREDVFHLLPLPPSSRQARPSYPMTVCRCLINTEFLCACFFGGSPPASLKHNELDATDTSLGASIVATWLGGGSFPAIFRPHRNDVWIISSRGCRVLTSSGVRAPFDTEDASNVAYSVTTRVNAEGG